MSDPALTIEKLRLEVARLRVENMHLEIKSARQSATISMLTKELADISDSLGASNDETAAFLDALSAPAAPLHHRPQGLAEEALLLHNAASHRKFDTAWQPKVVEPAPEHPRVKKVHPLRAGRQTGFTYHEGKLRNGSYTRDPTFELGLCENAFLGDECPHGAQCNWRHRKITDAELALPGFHGKGRAVVTRSFHPQKFERTLWDDLE